jgi:hypothetical protein
MQRRAHAIIIASIVEKLREKTGLPRFCKLAIPFQGHVHIAWRDGIYGAASSCGVCNYLSLKAHKIKSFS